MRNGQLNREALHHLSEQLFQRRVRDAIARFPFYASHVRQHRGTLPRAGDTIDSNDLPVWTRQNQRDFYAQQDTPPEWTFVHRTSGTVGSKVFFHVPRESYEWRMAAADRGYIWAGAEEGQRSFYLWGASREQPPLWQRIKRHIDNALQRRWFHDAFQSFNDDRRQACCRAINRRRPDTIVGYTGMLVDLARYARDNTGALHWKARTVVTAAEGLEPGQRELLEEYLADELFDSYGSREFMNIGMECEHHNGYHIPSDTVFVEIVDNDGRRVPPGERGRIVVTDLRNAATPFIRYEIGDYGTMAPPEPCPCGRPFPLLASVDGRIHDVIRTADGRMLTALYVTYALRDCHWVEGHQVVQNGSDRLLIRLLTNEEPTAERMAVATANLQEKLGKSMSIEYERVDSLTRTETGKVVPVISPGKDS